MNKLKALVIKMPFETDKKFTEMFQGLASLSASKAEVETSES